MVDLTSVDVDDVSSWPSPLREHVDEWLERLQGAPAASNEPEVAWDADEPLLPLLGGRALRMYHCTCLLDHEGAQIREQGLRRLSRDLVEERIHAARGAGVITVDEAELLHRSHVYRGRDHHIRTGRVWLFAGQAVLDDTINLRAFLTTWGGEGM